MEIFVTNPEILRLVDDIREKGLNRKHYSDIVDQKGNQYVDLVQEGGGVLGIALSGYTYILEKAGIRFFSLAGTSAGAINTLLIASMSPIGEPVTEKILKVMGDMDLFDFVDGNPRIKRLIQRYIEDRPCLFFYILLNSVGIWRALTNYLGINPGDAFESWISKVLGESGITTWSDLRELRSVLPPLFDRSDGNSVITRKADIQIIASDITTKSKIVFPEMAELYWSDPESVSPSKFVRASMSIPFFFFPFQVRNIPDSGKYEDPGLPKEETRWRRHAAYYGKIPDVVRFVDGGILSNFPINAFHISGGIPKKPTFGVKLSTWRGNYSKTDRLGDMTGAMIGTMRQLHDYEFLRKNPDYNRLICHLDADTSFNWLDFNMSKEKQVDLFILGAREAFRFLETFNWLEYKKLRAERANTR